VVVLLLLLLLMMLLSFLQFFLQELEILSSFSISLIRKNA